MKSNIQIFKNEVFGEIRTCQVNNQIMFVGKDVATALGYANTRKAVLDHVDKEDREDGVTIRDAIGRDQKATFINESGLYSLILSSKLPQAKAFKRWVTAEVLPQIRQTGGYIPTRDADGRHLSSKEIIERADAIVGCTLRMLNEPAEDTLTATQVAKTFNMTVFDFNHVLRDMGIQYRRGGHMTVFDFNHVLRDMGIQYRRGGHWNISDDLADRDLTRLRTHVSYSLKGSKTMSTTVGMDIDVY